MKILPKAEHEMGYPPKQLSKILKELGISKRKFNKAFGVNTCVISKKGEVIVYVCDVQKTLYNLGHKLGINYLWD